MADNVTVGNTSGQDNDYVVASDDDGTAQHQYVKMEWGADGTQTKVASGAAAVPIQDGGNTITVDGTVTANLGAVDNAVLDAIQTAAEAIQAAAEAIETAVEGTLTVNASGTAVPVTDNNSTLTVDGTVAVTNAALTELAAAIDTQVQVDVVGALPAGTNAIGKLAANSGVDIGDVDVTSISAGDNVIGRVKISDGTDVADVLDLTNTNPLTVAVVDGDGTQVTTFGGSGGTASADGTAFNNDTTEGTPLMGAYQSSPDAMTDGDLGVVGITVSREMKVDLTSAEVSEMPPTPLAPQSAGFGALIFHSNDLDETEEDVNDGACYLYGYSYANRTTAPLYLHFYNDVAANVTVGTTAPEFIVEIPANSSDHIAGHISFTIPIGFDTGLSVAATTDFPDDGSPAGPAANGCIFTAFYFPAA